MNSSRNSDGSSCRLPERKFRNQRLCPSLSQQTWHNNVTARGPGKWHCRAGGKDGIRRRTVTPGGRAERALADRHQLRHHRLMKFNDPVGFYLACGLMFRGVLEKIRDSATERVGKMPAWARSLERYEQYATQAEFLKKCAFEGGVENSYS
jgi:hypothetical protein